MTELLNDIDTPSDGELISRVRGGDVAAYGELFSRHVTAANRLARQLVRGPDADDLVAEAFAKVLSVLQGGGGPDVAFRAYLLTAVRRLHVDRIRATSKLQTTDDLTPFDPGIPFQDTAVAGFESGAAAKAFASLPERWQLVLWHLEVEGQKPADIAPLLGMSANSVSALAYRAREGLRQAFLTMHLSDISDTSCRWVNEHLGAYVRNGLSKRDTGKVKSHLDDCRRCTAMYLELTEVNSNLSGIIAPLLLGAAATGYLTSTGGIGSAGVLSLVGRVRDVVAANATAATAGAVAVGVAAAAVVGITLATGHPKSGVIGADEPAGTVSSAPASPGTDAPTARKPAKTSATTTVPAATAASQAASQAAFLPAAVPTAAATPAATPAAASSDSPGPSPASSPSQTSPSPGGGPSGSTAPVPNAAVEVSVGVHVDNSGATITVHGDAGLPPTFGVEVTSSPDGITFRADGTCPLATPTTVTCTTLSGGGGTAAVPGTGALLAAGKDFTATLPFAIPSAQPDTDLQVTVSLPEGYTDPTLGDRPGVPFRYHAPVPPVVPAPDVTLTLPGTTHEDGNDPTADTFTLDATVSGLPDGTGSVSFTSAGLTFVEANGCTADLAGSGVACPVDAGTATVHPVVSYAGTTPAPVIVTATVGDPAASGLLLGTATVQATATAPTTLEPEPLDALQADSAQLTLQDQNSGTLEVAFSGAATGRPVTLGLTDKNGRQTDLRLLTDPADQPDCEVVDAYTATCPAGLTPVRVNITVPAGLDEGTVTVTDGVHTPDAVTFVRPQDSSGEPPAGVTESTPRKSAASSASTTEPSPTARPTVRPGATVRPPAHRPGRARHAHPGRPGHPAQAAARDLLDRLLHRPGR